MSSIRIVSIPPGDPKVPEWVLKEWVGLEIPLPIEDGEDGIGDNYETQMEPTLRELGKKSPEAANWWRGLIWFPVRFVFPKNVCEII